MEDLTQYLTEKGCQVFQTSGHEVTTHCFLCSDGDSKGKGKLYLNTESWLWDCKRCGERGNRRTLLRHFGDQDTVEYLPGEDPNVRRRILEEATQLAADCLSNNEKMMLYLLGRGLSPETIVQKRLGYVPRSFGLSSSLPGEFTRKDLETSGLLTAKGSEFYRGMITIPYFSRGQVVQLRAKDPAGKYFTATGDNVRLYNADALADCDEVVVTEGEFDGMVLEQVLSLSTEPRFRRMGVVSLAGAAALPGGAEGFAKYFATQRKVFLGLDPDDTGRREAIKIKALIGTKARIVELPTDLPKCDWTEFVNGRSQDCHDVAGLVTLADLAGKRVYSMTDAATRWQRLESEQPGIKLGFKELDAIIAPGIKPGNLVIPMAKTGCIQGDALIAVNRGGKGFTIKLKDLVDRWEGRKYAWDHSTDTYVQREVDGQVRLGRLLNAWCSGTKITYTVTTETGRTIRATDEHPFLTERGWLRLDELVEGDLVHVRGQRGDNGRSAKPVYAKRTVPLHPYAGRRSVKNGGHSVLLHRLVAEAGLNGLDLGTFLDRCRQGPVEGLRFLDPSAWAVHHLDHDPSNNDPGNLKVLTHPEHAALHAAEGTTRNVQVNVAHERVVSVVLHGEEVTYDLEVADDPHNFMANGFVVHNTGKTVFLGNIAYYTRSRFHLMISLEQTASEVYDVMRKITRFWQPFHSHHQIASEYPNLRIVDENRLTSEDFTMLLEEYREELGRYPELVSVDYLGYYARGAKGGSPYEKTSNAVMQLKAEAKAHDLAIIVPHQVNRGAKDGKPLDADEARDSGVVEETADFMFGLYKPDEAVEGGATQGGAVTGSLRAGVLKSRKGGKGRQVQLRMSAASLVICDESNRKAVMRVEQENAMVNQGMTYEDIYRTQSQVQQSLRLAT